jgi:uncharacterized protein
MKDEINKPPLAWWRHAHVWLVIAGPGAVVVASMVTAWLAANGQDPVVAEDYYRRGMEMNKTLAAEKAALSALQGRNHAATPPAAVPR